RTVTRGGSTYSMNTENIGKGRAAEAETTTPAVGADEQPADEQARAADASAKRIERARKEDAASAKAPILDGENDPVPDHLRDDFASSALADYLEKLRGVADSIDYKALASRAKQLAAVYPFVRIENFLGSLKLIRDSFEDALVAAEDGLIYAVCPLCKG